VGGGPLPGAQGGQPKATAQSESSICRMTISERDFWSFPGLR
jgi:hypothetical protein